MINDILYIDKVSDLSADPGTIIDRNAAVFVHKQEIVPAVDSQVVFRLGQNVRRVSPDEM